MISPSCLSGAPGLDSRGLLSNDCPVRLRGAVWGYGPILPLPIFSDFQRLSREHESLSRHQAHPERSVATASFPVAHCGRRKNDYVRFAF
jgi:hypothetical protein